jgi:hypothetical protein
MANIEQTNDIGYARPECQPHQLAMTTMTNSSSTQSVFSPSVQRTLPQTQQQQQQSTQLTDIQSQINKRPPSTVPSDDEFIENMISDNLCAKQLRDVIKPIAIPSSPPSSPGQDISSNSTSNTKSPKRRSSKYDAQMRYQTSRIN